MLAIGFLAVGCTTVLCSSVTCTGWLCKLTGVFYPGQSPLKRPTVKDCWCGILELLGQVGHGKSAYDISEQMESSHLKLLLCVMTKIVRDFTKTESENRAYCFPCSVRKNMMETCCGEKAWCDNHQRLGYRTSQFSLECVGNLDTFLIFYRSLLIFQDQYVWSSDEFGVYNLCCC